MDFLLNIVEKKKKLVIDETNPKIFVLNKKTIDVFDEQENFPRLLPHPVQLEELVKYYSIRWKRNNFNSINNE